MSNRVARRAQTKSQKKERSGTPSRPPGVAPRPPEGNPLDVPQLRKLEADIEQLGGALNHNAQLFSHALTISEMRMRVLERALNDSLVGAERTVQAERMAWLDDGTSVTEKVPVIDYGYYTNYFALCLLVTNFATWLAGLSPRKAPEETSRIVPPDYEGATIFGGAP